MRRGERRERGGEEREKEKGREEWAIENER